MKKIPTLFLRDPVNQKLVTPEPHDDCLWVLAGEGTATRKLDGTSCLWKGGRLWKRHELQVRMSTAATDSRDWVHLPEHQAPAGWEPAQEHAEGPDSKGRYKVPGWVPVGTGPEDRWHREARFATVAMLFPEKWPLGDFSFWKSGLSPSDGETLELIGPKVNGNPEGVTEHLLILHGTQHPTFPLRLPTFSPGDLSFDGIRSYLEQRPMEGIVFWHPDGRMAKIKRRDFGLQWPVKA